MKIHATALVLTLSLGIPLLVSTCSEEPEPPAVDGFAQATETGLVERRQFGLVRTLRGSFRTPDSSGSPAEAATSFIESYASEFGLTDVEQELGEAVVIEDGDGGAAVELPRLAGGYPIVASLIRVHLDAEGMVTFVSAALPARAELAVTEATVAQADAVEAAREALGAGDGSGHSREPTLLAFNVGLVTGEEAETRLAWEVRLEVWDPPARPVAYVDAVTGELLYAYDALVGARGFTYDADHGANVVTLLGRQSAADHRPALGEPYDTESCRGGPICNPDDLLDDCCGTAALWYVDDEPDPVAGTTPTPQAETVHRALRTVQAWYLERLGRDGWDWRGGASHALAHFGTEHEVQAYWDPIHEVMAFYDRASSPDFVAHEFTHAVSSGSYSSLMNEGEPGAIGESFSDVFAVLIGGDWEMTLPDASVERDLDANAERRIADTESTLLRLAQGELPSADNDHGHVHFNSGLMTRVAELLLRGGQHWVTRVNVARVGDDAGDAMVGQRRFEQIWYRALSVWLTPSSTFEDAREQIVGACLWLAKWPSNPGGVRIRDCGSILQAFNAVGIGAYDTDRDAWDDDVDNCRDEYNPEQLDLDEDGIGDGCEDGAESDADLPDGDADADADADGDADADADADGDADGDADDPTESSARCPGSFTGYGCVPLVGVDTLCARSTSCERAEDVSYASQTDAEWAPLHQDLERGFLLGCGYAFDPDPAVSGRCDWTFEIVWAYAETTEDTPAMRACDNPGQLVELPAGEAGVSINCAYNSLSHRAAVLTDCMRSYNAEWFAQITPFMDQLLSLVEPEAASCP